MEIKDSFLLDEVRCGFMIPAAVKQAWAAELEVLAEIDRVCKKHNIQYFADWGTLLGTIRHGGFIPWDDDLDIVMKREDYNKFITVARLDMKEGFDVQTYRNHDDCWLFMGKVVGRNGFSFEKEHLRRFHNFPYIACVDVFVLDYVYRDPEKEEKRRTLCKYMLGVADSIGDGSLIGEKREQSLKRVEEMCGKKIQRIADGVEMRRYLYGEVEKIFAEVPEQEADVLTQLFPWGLKGNAFQFPKEYYEKSVYLPYECTYMPVSAVYDKMLRMRYGEYLRLVKDTAGHNYPFFEGQKRNLQKVLDFKLPEFQFDKSKLCRSEEEEGYKKLSYKWMAKECVGEQQRIREQLLEVIGQGDLEQAVGLLQMSQQLAIDLGNMLEEFLGEENSIIPLLEQCCEELYALYEKLMAAEEAGPICDKLGDIHERINAELEQKVFNRQVVLFLPVLTKDWKYLHHMWQESVDNSLYDVYVVPLPYYYKDYDGSARRVCCETTEFPKELKALDYTLLSPEYLEMLHPEVIVIQNPYDSWNPAIAVPEAFYAENIRKYTDKLIYVPPFEVEEYAKRNEREYFNMKYYVTMPGVVYADQVMVQSENMKRLYVEKLTQFAGEETREVWEQRMTLKEWQIVEPVKCNPDSDRKRILYGISIATYLEDAEAVQRKIERSFQFFEKYSAQIDVTVHLFPGNDETVEIREYITGLLKKYPGKVLDPGRKCDATEYDAYYGDAMPLVMEFREADKPVMIQDFRL